MVVTQCGPNLYYVCAPCKKDRSPHHPFNRDCENAVGRKACHFCGDATPYSLDIVTGGPYEVPKNSKGLDR